jgi:hypothetical protein
MAKKRKTLDEHIHYHLQFRNTNEFIIFMLWALFVCAFLLTIK